MRMIQAEWEVPFEPVHHAGGFSFPAMPVITSEQPNKVQRYQWGLIPHWVQQHGGCGKAAAANPECTWRNHL